MATRSRIGMVLPDGTVRSIYCHYDGYVSNNGRLLHDHYTDPAKIAGLIALGSLSTLEASIEAPEGHSFATKEDGHTVAYHRDRGEDIDPGRVDPTVDDWWQGDNEEFAYLWYGTQWWVTGGDHPDTDEDYGLRTLVEALVQDKMA
jgi:hypothetical protein